MALQRYHKLAIAGGIVGLVVPAVITMNATSVSATDGVLTSYSYFNLVAIGCGLVTIGLGVALFRRRRDSGLAALRTPPLWRAIAAVVVLLGVFQVVRGAGVFPMLSDCTTVHPSLGFCKPAPSVIDDQ